MSKKTDWIPASRYIFNPAPQEEGGSSRNWGSLMDSVTAEVIARFFPHDKRLRRHNACSGTGSNVMGERLRRRDGSLLISSFRFFVLEIEPPPIGEEEIPARLGPRAMAAVLCAFTEDEECAYTLPFRPGLPNYSIHEPPRHGYLVSCGAKFSWAPRSGFGGEGFIIELTLWYYDNPDIHDHLQGHVKMWFRVDPARDLFEELDAKTLRTAAPGWAFDSGHMLKQAEEQESWEAAR